MTDIELYEPVPAGRDGRPTPEQLVLRWLTTKRSGHTRSSYGRDLGVQVPRPGVTEPGTPQPGRAPNWLTYCASIGVDPLGAVLEEHVALWARGMEAAGLAPATVARRMAAVSSWYAWLTRHKHVAANPAAELARPYVDPDISKTPGLTKQQALALLAYADTMATPQGPRNGAMAGLLLYTGARVSEATGATMADLGVDRGHRVLWVTRKGGTRQPLVLPPPTLARLDAYFAARDDLEQLPALPGHASTAPKPLIATTPGRRMRDADVWSLMRRLAKGAGLPPELAGHLGAHGMRHTFGTLALDAGVPLRDLQDAMGHKDPRTTRRYDRARGRLDRSPGYALAGYLADSEAE